ncbi:SSI family serine proteinase inhibitor [Streptomyces sp. NPDC054766]|uniref:SSI family serine proteinase inhibitor n=1 Tax=Streptomyces rhizosphaerihabitans TaxID=1266770 RepID=UPI0021BE0040|nr:SSI family serine proteinase inhibitor [Streptomyces rhizosphaerihabitans]MCT9005427.1 SSI family serine proteinase inhibitor [Streptomyces rhizosphaerihabitans]
MLRRLLLTAAVSATAALSTVPSATAGTPSEAPGVFPVPMASPAGPSAAFPSGPSSLFPAGPSSLSAAAYGVALPALMPPPARPEDSADSADRLTVTVHDVGGGADGTFELECHPAGGSHPHAAEACDRLDRMTTWGKDTFAPVPPDTLCTMEYGGPATAHVTGTWAGRPVDARYDRSNGCEISRWNALMPLLPGARP